VNYWELTYEQLVDLLDVKESYLDRYGHMLLEDRGNGVEIYRQWLSEIAELRTVLERRRLARMPT
jgi:hypothetical protein